MPDTVRPPDELFRLHAVLHRRPAEFEHETITLPDGRRLSVLQVDPSGALPLSTTFDRAAEQLAALPGTWCEPDGSFFLTAALGARVSRLDGQLVDGRETLDHVVLQGTVTAGPLDALLGLFSGADALMFQLVRLGVYVDEAVFREFARQGSGEPRP